MNKAAQLRLFPAIFFLCVTTFLLGLHLGTTRVSGNAVSPAPSTTDLIGTETPEDLTVDFNHFWQVWDLIHTDHIDRAEFDDQELVYGAIRGMVQAIGDPYTAFLPPERNEAFAESLSGTYEGIGAELGMEDNQLLIVAPLDGSPALAAGLQPLDRIIQIEDEDTFGITIPEAVRKIRGPAGEPIRLTLYREGNSESFEVTIVRDQIQLHSVKFDQTKLQVDNVDFSSEGVGYLRMSRFGDNTAEEWNAAVDNMLATVAPLNAVILDLRSNPGGYLTVSIELAGDFLPRGTTVVQQQSKDGKVNSFQAQGKARLANVPVIVLVNEGSASASEILASALKENRTDVTLVGQKTFGKGTVQEKRDLPDGSGVQVTIAKWLTSQGVWVNDTDGVAVDVEVEVTPEDIEVGRDPQLEKALELAR